MKQACLVIAIILTCSCSQQEPVNSNDQSEKKYIELDENSIINLYDAFGDEKYGLTKDFGFSCIIQYNGNTILFDGGTNANIFKNNVEVLNIDLSKVDIAIASHSHFDHINGFDYLLAVNPDVKLYFPFDLFWGANIPFNLTGKDSSITDSLEKRMQYFDGDYHEYRFNQTGRFWNANIEFIKGTTEIASGVKLITTSSPFMGYFNKYPNLEPCENCESPLAKFNGLNEISLSLTSENGEILFVGCSHSTVEQIISDTKEYTNNDIEMVYGGYHLLPYGREALGKLSDRLKNELNVNKVAPAHCTGHLAFKILQNQFGDDYIFAGLGETVNF